MSQHLKNYVHQHLASVNEKARKLRFEVEYLREDMEEREEMDNKIEEEMERQRKRIDKLESQLSAVLQQRVARSMPQRNIGQRVRRRRI